MATVWVTRPAGQGDELASALQTQGYEVVNQPAIQIARLSAESSDAKAAKQHVLDLDNFQHVIFISTNAVAQGMALVEDYWPQLPVEQQWYGIGSATVAALAEYGVTAIGPSQQQNSEGLLALPALQTVAGEKVLIFAGVGGREYLAKTLQQRQASVQMARCYERQLPKQMSEQWRTALQHNKINMLVAGSVEAVTNSKQLAANVGVDITHMPIVVPGERATQAAQSLGFSQVVTAVNASNAAMIAAIVQLGV